MPIPAIVTAGDRRAARAVYGESKVFLDLAWLPLVAHVVLVLQEVPEVSEVWVVGDAERLRGVFDRPDVRDALRKPLHVVEQFRNLYENAWETYRRALPGAGPEGRDPQDRDLDAQVLYLSGDLPFATPQEISEFIRRGQALDCDYALGLASDRALDFFLPASPDEPGLDVAFFNLREGRLRQNNLHLVRPARLGNRHYIEEMYEHRHQRELGNMVALAWRLLRSEQGGLRILLFYALMHLASLADRWHWPWLAERLRRRVALDRVEKAVGQLLRTDFRFVTLESGGCVVDVDREEEYDAVCARYEEWSKAQAARAEELYGRPALPASSSPPPGPEGAPPPDSRKRGEP